MPNNAPHNALRHHVTGAIERGEGEPITEIAAPDQLHPNIAARMDAIAKAMVHSMIPQSAFDLDYLTRSERAAFLDSWNAHTRNT